MNNEEGRVGHSWHQDRFGEKWKFIESCVEKVGMEGAVNVFETAVQDLLVDHV